jgi:hypothetical protein
MDRIGARIGGNARGSMAYRSVYSLCDASASDAIRSPSNCRKASGRSSLLAASLLVGMSIDQHFYETTHQRGKYGRLLKPERGVQRRLNAEATNEIRLTIGNMTEPNLMPVSQIPVLGVWPSDTLENCSDSDNSEDPHWGSEVEDEVK